MVSPWHVSRDVLETVVPEACEGAGASLSAFAQESVAVMGSHLEQVPWRDLPRAVGPHPGASVVAAILGVEGDGPAVLALVFSRSAAERLAALMMGAEESVPLDDMALSALGEVANITGTTFLNVLADRLSLRLTPTIPYVLYDQIGAILQAIVPDAARAADRVTMVKTAFHVGTRSIDGHLLWVPADV
jgi:chemotaxis protein CheC